MLLCWSYTLQLWWLHVLAVVVFLMNSLGCPTYRIMSSVNRDSFTSSCPIWVACLCVCLTAPARTSRIVLNIGGESASFPPSWSQRESLQSFTTKYGPFMGVLSMSRQCLLFDVFWGFLGWRVFDFVRHFFYVSWGDHVLFFPLVVLIWYTTLIDFFFFNHPCFSGINPTWSCVIPLICCWIQFSSILLKDSFVEGQFCWI